MAGAAFAWGMAAVYSSLPLSTNGGSNLRSFEPEPRAPKLAAASLIGLVSGAAAGYLLTKKG